MTFKRQGLATPYSLELLKRRHEAITRKNRVKVFFAVDNQGNPHSALYLIWDDQSSYVHLTGEDPQLRSSGAGMLLIWEAIQFTKNDLGLNNFDFEGSMHAPIERVRRSFGAKQQPYFRIRKFNSKILKIFDFIHTLGKE